MANLPNIYTFSHYSPVETILVLGCGGTGAYVVSHLSRLLSSLSDYDVKLFLADGDVVEEKNLKRQHFISTDINKNKASVLAERYSSVFGIEIGVIPKDIETLTDLDFFQDVSLDRNASDLIIGCVDNNASRKLVYEWFKCRDSKNYRSNFWIDAGNEERAGQVICGYAPGNSSSYGRVRIRVGGNNTQGEFSMPCVMEHYPELLESEDTFNSELSCAERAISAPQNMQTNVTAATLAVNYTQKIILGEPLYNHGVEFSIDNVFSTKLNTQSNLEMVDNQRKAYWEK